MQVASWWSKRALAPLVVISLLCGARDAAAARVNPHNVGSCASCHTGTPRFGADTIRDVGFTLSADNPGLCLPCHSPKEHAHPSGVDAGSGPSGARVSAHLPPGTSPGWAGKVVCTTCHLIHAAEARQALLRGLTGSGTARFESDVDFCIECHGNNLKSRPAHAGGDRSCVFCHAGKPGSQVAVEGLDLPGKRCEVCHRGLKSEHYSKRTPFGKRSGCTPCHDQHALLSASPGLFSKAFREAAQRSPLVRPHYSSRLCFTCHENLDDYALLKGSINETCDRCHGTGEIPPNIHPLNKVPETIKVPSGWPLVDGALTCLTCHDQGHDDQTPRKLMLHGGPYTSGREVCRNCHGATDLEKSKIHQRINEDSGCEMCHRTRPVPGVSTIQTVDFIADPDLLCMRCHDQSPLDGSVHHSGVLGREIEPGHMPVDLPMYNKRIICASCHNPHLLTAAGLRLRAAVQNTELCTGCHRE